MEYQRVRAERISTLTGVKDVHSWDLNLSSGYVPMLTFEQARMRYGECGHASRRGVQKPLHLAGRPGQRCTRYEWRNETAAGGFSVGYPSVPTSLYVDRFNGNLDSIDQLDFTKPVMPSIASS